MINELKETIISPKKAANAIAPKTSIVDGLKILTIGFVISFILNAVFFTLSTLITGVINMILGTGTISTSIALIIGFIIGMGIFFIPILVVSIVVSFIVLGIIWGVAKILGGKSDFGSYFGSMQYATWSVSILSALVTGVLGLLTAIAMGFSPLIGGLVSAFMALPSIIIGFYGFYVTVIFTREVNKLSTIKAVVAVIVPTLLVFGFMAVIAVLIVAALGLTMGGLLGGLPM